MSDFQLTIMLVTFLLVITLLAVIVQNISSMEIPFIFGKLAAGNEFTDRKAETIWLKSNFLAGVNTIMISPRRWGKSSLVEKTGEEIVKENAIC